MADNKLSLIVSFIGQDKLSGALRNIIGLGKTGDQALKGLFQEARGLKNEMKSLDSEIEKAAGNVTPLIDRQRELAEQLARVNGQIDRQKRLNAFDADTRRIAQRGSDLRGKGAENVLEGAAMATPFVLATKGAMDFSSGMVDIQQKANLTNIETDRMANSILLAARAAHQLPEELRSGVDVLAGFGMDPRQAAQMIAPIGRTATAYKAEIADLSASSFANFNNLKISVLDTANALDIMAAGGKAGAFEIKDMARYFPGLTAQAQALGQSGLGAVSDLTAALQIARRATGTSEEAATNVQNLLAKINSKGTITAFQKNFGVDLPAALKRAYREGKTPMEAIAEITRQATGGDLSKISFAFEDMQAQSAVRALILNMKDYQAIRAQIAQSGGTIDADFTVREARDGAVNLASLMGSIQALGITVGTKLLPLLTPVIQHLTAGAEAIAAWAQANPALAQTVVSVAAAFVAGKVALGGLQFAFGSVLQTVATARTVFSTVSGLFSGFGSIASALPLLLSPVGLAIMAVVAVVAGAAYLIYRNWSGISGFFKSHWTQIRNVFLGAMVIFTPMVAAVVFVAVQIYRHWDQIKAATMSMVHTVAGVVGPFLRPFRAIIGFLGGIVGQFFSFGANIIGGLIRGIVSMTGSVLKAIINLAGQIGAKFAASLGIHSPSRVFMGLGGHIAAGLTLGIEKGAGGPVKAMARMAASVAGAGAVSIAAPAMALAAEPTLAPASAPLRGRLPAMLGSLALPPISVTNALPGMPDISAGGVLKMPALPQQPSAIAPLPTGMPTIQLPRPAEVSRPAAAPRPVASERQAQPITINIHQQPGEDGEALAQRVMKLLERAQGSTRRRRMEDDF